MACIGFSTTLVYRYRDMLHTKFVSEIDPIKKDKLFEKVKKADHVQFWCFFIGIYKDHRTVE